MTKRSTPAAYADLLSDLKPILRPTVFSDRPAPQAAPTAQRPSVHALDVVRAVRTS